MQIVENWVFLIGVIMGVLPSSDLPDHYEVHVKIEALEPVEAFPMLLQGAEGDTIVVLARRSQVKDPDSAVGEQFSACVRAAGPQPLKYFVTPDWSLNE